MSYSTNVRINEKEKEIRNKQNLQLANIAVSQYKKYYKNVYFITDTEGQETFKDVKFTEVFNILDIVPKEYQDVWSLGKMYAIRHIASLKKQFCHSDMDFFIRKPFKENIMNAEVFAQSYEYSPYLWSIYYRPGIFFDFCKNKYLATNAFEELDGSVVPERSILKIKDRFPFAPIPLCCGVLGGKNHDFFYEYADTSIKMVEDPQNMYYWLDPDITKTNWGTKAIIAEQLYLSCCLKKYQIKPEVMFKNSFTEYDPLINQNEDFQHWINEKKDLFLRLIEEKAFYEKYLRYLDS